MKNALGIHLCKEKQTKQKSIKNKFATTMFKKKISPLILLHYNPPHSPHPQELFHS